ncbi:MAG: class I tRNA ligase family protein [Candidatus Moeniiplasma glomeromycotorum]|nr:class I tRNA ligase family protein [Candidatus Moeniiplasma glomeromycotorum]MCE8167157.1 class I tRNA ligase family protein [Candidatus Moeniiplasma glomeromycotorum]MCE8168831.1 class I tRNA ligase family protein [Candidatus Moeniiplasma glomeromycotorum]
MNVRNLKKTNKKKIHWPATLYVEGQDQFRGWFNSSLITSTILTGQAPYQQVLSHGFLVDEKGHKMSKSLGNVIDPEEIMEKFGADVLRLWVISSDFTKEVKISLSLLTNLQASYQKIRNTLRFLLRNLSYLPSTWKSEDDLEKELNLVDYYVFSRLEKLITESQKNYSEYNFNPIYTSLLNFCANDLSSFYFEISKDSLYCDNLNSLRRKQIITAFYYLLWGLLKVISPILPFLAEEIYQNIPFRFGFTNKESVHLVNYPPTPDFSFNIEKKLKIITDFFFPLRQEVYQVCEQARQVKIINTNSQASLTIYLKEKKWDFSELNLMELLLVSEINWVENPTPDMKEGKVSFIKVVPTKNKRCLRCWNYRKMEGEICPRCQTVLNIHH